MATARSSSKKALPTELPPDLAAEVERAVRSAGALPLTKLTKVKLADEARAELLRRLVAAGLDRTPKVVRVPVEAQIGALLQGGGRVALKDLAKRVKGGQKQEIDAAIDRLVKGGAARVVVRTQVEVLVGAADDALDRRELTELVKASAALAKVLKKVTAKGRERSLLRSDLAAIFDAVAPRPAVRGPADAAAIVAEALRRLEHPALKLVRVPELVRAIADRVPLAEAHRALLAAASAGTIELRPEAGAEFLSEDDARLCPPGPRGTVFSYARLLST